MAEKSTIARPYALAIFRLAEQQQQLPRWTDVLALLAAITEDPAMVTLIGNPRISQSRLRELFYSVGGEHFDDEARSLVSILIDNGRIALLPDIAVLYERYRAEAESIVQAEVISAYAVSSEQQETIAAALKARLGRDVTITCSVDETLIGGAIIRAGDMVIDGSVTGHLGRLTTALSQ